MNYFHCLFNGFSVPADGFTTVKVFDAYGREVKVLFSDEAKSGVEYKVAFDGSSHSAGMYFYSIVSSEMNVVKKVQMIKYKISLTNNDGK